MIRYLCYAVEIREIRPYEEEKTTLIYQTVWNVTHRLGFIFVQKFFV